MFLGWGELWGRIDIGLNGKTMQIELHHLRQELEMENIICTTKT
jgi:hypothetical protein